MGPVPQPEEDRDHPIHNNGNDIEDAEHPDVMINVDISDSDSDDDDGNVHGGYIGYQALSQDVGTANQDSDTEDDSQDEETAQSVESLNTLDSCHGDVERSIPEGLIQQVRHPDFPNTANLPGYMQVPELPKPEKKDMLWNQHRQTDIPLETDHADQILSVMSNIQLPTSHIPDWARSISDDQWQLQVVNKLVKQKTSPKNNSDMNKGTSQTVNQTTDMTEQSCQTGVKEASQDVNEDETVKP